MGDGQPTRGHHQRLGLQLTAIGVERIGVTLTGVVAHGVHGAGLPQVHAAALRAALENGEPKAVAGGVVEGEAFYCAAILGSPALWAPAREAMREGRLKLAWV